ncbi:MAG: hypothetical protein WCJ93_12570 [Methanomicrobiales archaeon]
MPHRGHKNFFYLSSFALILLVLTLFSGCVGTDQAFKGNNSSIPAIVDSGKVPPLQNTTIQGNSGAEEPDYTVNIEPSNHDQLEKAWKTFRVINTDTNERYLKLDLYKSDDINYFRYQIVPETVRKIELLRSDLYQIEQVNDDERNDTEALIEITNYTILKYEGLATVMHATQYVAIGDPVKMKAELRKAKFQIMDALDIINDREISEYPSMYRDLVIADKRELDDMASQVDTFIRSVYLSPPVWGSGT